MRQPPAPGLKICIKAIIAAGLCMTAVMPAACAATDAKRAAVEANLLPAIVIADAPQGWTIAERLARYNTPGASIAVIEDGELVWAAGYGVTTAESGEPVTDETVFQAASLSKDVAAVTALTLVEDGTLTLDEDVNTRLISWKVPPGEQTADAPVTLRGLLSHTAGIGGHGFRGYAPDEARPTLVQILNGDAPANSPPVTVETKPGEGYSYSGGGYEIVELLMQDASGEAFPALAERRVLAPAGMTRSAFLTIPPAALTDHAARGHGYDGATVEGGWSLYPEHAAASLWSTPSDIARFVMSVSAAWRGDTGEVLDPDSAREMLTPSPVEGAGGLGPGLHGEGDAVFFDHAGWNEGYRAYVAAYPATGDGVVVMANSDGADLLIEEIVRAVAAAYDWPDFAPETRDAVTLPGKTLDRLAGTYIVDGAGFPLTLTRDGDHLVMQTPRGSSYTFYAESEDRFFAIEDGSPLTFETLDDGAETLKVWVFTARKSS